MKWVSMSLLATMVWGCGQSEQKDDRSSSGLGGSASGGTSNGGSASGGTSNEGSASGGTSNEGSASGGTSNGGSASGGTSNEGSASGGTSFEGSDSVGGSGSGGASGKEQIDCSEALQSLPFGNYQTAMGEQHWLRWGVRGATYSVLPAGDESVLAPPRVFRIVEGCSVAALFFVESSTGEYGRVEYRRQGERLLLCGPETLLEDLGSVRKLARSDENALGSGCFGGPWVSLTEVGR